MNCYGTLDSGAFFIIIKLPKEELLQWMICLRPLKNHTLVGRSSP